MDYKKLGLKCGIEIHQQIEGQKLFCTCSALIRDTTPHAAIIRKLRASAGESGQVDIAAAQEQLKNKTFIYESYDDSTCLVEVDEEPPHDLNPQAMYTTLQFCKMVDAAISSVVQVMRKTVVDGSNTSGFQRTALVGRAGSIKTSLGDVGIANISLEEDACRIISETATEKRYRLDRLGIPLIEIGTDPDITSPEHCQEVARTLGMLLRSLPSIKRGLGTIRQDVNISIAGGNRIEIKGAQDLRQLPLLVELEVKRQRELLKIKKELGKKKLGALQIRDLTHLLKTTEAKVIQNTLEKNGKVLAIKLEHLHGFLGRELQPNYRLGSELSGRAKIKAGVGGIFHSDELPKYGINQKEVELVLQELKCSKKDAFVLIADTEKKAKLALEAVHERAAEVFKGIPKEVRKANPDSTTSFLRPMPGASRMYPETDVPLVFADYSQITIPEILEQKIERFESMGLSKDLATFIAKSENVYLFEELTAQHKNIKPAFIAETLTSTLLEIKRKYDQNPEKLTEDNLRAVFTYLAEDKIHKDIVLDVLIDMIKDTFDIKKYQQLGTEKIHQELVNIIKSNPQAPFPALMGIAMKQLAGKASGKFISDELKKILEQGHI